MPCAYLVLALRFCVLWIDCGLGVWVLLRFMVTDGMLYGDTRRQWEQKGQLCKQQVGLAVLYGLRFSFDSALKGQR
jgi:hypothetical protein